MATFTNAVTLIQRIQALDETIKHKISKHLQNDNDQVVVSFDKVERMCRDRGELYGYARLVERESMDKNSYKIVIGRIRHLETCNGLNKKG